MKTANVQLKSISPYSQSRYHAIPRGDDGKESADDHEKRTWRERQHFNGDGTVFIPPMAFKLTIAECAKFLSIKIPGRGNATWTKHFDAGVLVMDGMSLGIDKDEVEGEWLFLNADGKKGGGTRVMKCYPVIPEWAGEITFHVIDDTITQKVFAHHIKQAGQFIGIGRFRPRNGGYYGRFSVENIDWQEAA